MCSSSAAWGQPSLNMKTPGDGGLAFSNFEPPPPDQYLFVSDLGQRDEKTTIPSAESTESDESQHQNFSSGASSAAPFAGGSLHPPRTSFTATNADDMHMRDTLVTSWMSPMQMHFNGDAGPFESYDKGKLSADDHAYSATSSSPTQWSYTMNRDAPMDKRRRESIRSQIDSAPCPTGRRRTFEKAEPGSARAVYLEKNRHAASKCRTKQKRQQEDLVETARNVERKNKVLKSEVELLKSDLRDLMELVGKHNECPDGRLRRYLQLEADRLSTQGNRSTAAELLSPKGSSATEGSSPVSP
ncbi:hypothetical protein P171DRAFT_426797 [Karstenula rhodostoma CBS 690.94]|uniref:BZIP domain-containing protein n=1 Tax=Karstenula rhodostoma CBS 690.94 TaxID=1392251 RepID=A0A9P4UI96_9PLEO|nr:hypothetical protein P171DRAFT_426797 [Karstenula rhodostoma CBS 690.94]